MVMEIFDIKLTNTNYYDSQGVKGQIGLEQLHGEKTFLARLIESLQTTFCHRNATPQSVSASVSLYTIT